MAENVIGTSSYSEAMDLSDLDDVGYDEESMGSPNDNSQQQQQDQQQQSPTLQYPEGNSNNPSAATAADAPPVKIRKKPGRKPNPASPALRKAQNRAAQRAFRERKERHMKDLESDIRGIKDHRDRLLHENEKMSSENEILKAENWYLKGIVLSLQLVCLQHNLVIPQHCPHLDDKTLSVLNQSIPESIASYINVNSKNKLQISSKLMNETNEMTNMQLQQQMQQQQQHLQQQRERGEQLRPPLAFIPQPIPQQLPGGSLIITQDGVHTVTDKRGSQSSSGGGGVSSQQYQQQQQSGSWYHQNNDMNENASQYSNHSSSTTTGGINTSVGDEGGGGGLYHNMPSLSPMSTADREKAETPPPPNHHYQQPPPLPRPVMLANEPVTSNLAAIQTLRLRLRLQSACVRMQSIPFAIQPTLLQVKQ